MRRRCIKMSPYRWRTRLGMSWSSRRSRRLNPIVGLCPKLNSPLNMFILRQDLSLIGPLYCTLIVKLSSLSLRLRDFHFNFPDIEHVMKTCKHGAPNTATVNLSQSKIFQHGQELRVMAFDRKKELVKFNNGTCFQHTPNLIPLLSTHASLLNVTCIVFNLFSRLSQLNRD